MYNILFTDDEDVVVQSLKFIIEKDFPNQFTCFSAESGAEAIRICYENKIDIAFLDIHMEGINGLDAIKDIRVANKNIIIIILSAFDRFNYAQEALELGVFRYLTKPQSRNTIKKTIEQALEKLDIENKQILNTLGIKEKLNALAPIVKNDFIYSLIYPLEESKDFNAYLEYFGIESSRYFFCIIELPSQSIDTKLKTYQSLLKSLTKNSECIAGPLMVNKVVVFFPLAKDSNSEQCYNSIKNIHQELSLSISSNIKIGVSNISENLSDSITFYNQAIDALANIKEQNAFLFYSDIKQNVEDKNKIDEYFQSLILKIKSGNKAEVIHSLQLFSNFASKQYNGNILKLKQLYTASIILAKQVTSEAKQAQVGLQELSNILGKMEDLTSEKQIVDFAQTQFFSFAKTLELYTQKNISPVVEKSINYINEHIAENFTLEDVADSLHIHPVTLSKLFHTSTGKTFKDYVNSERIKLAKKLLKTTTMTIKEITHTCGYNDQNYFSRLFKTSTGFTPKEYRKGSL